MNTFMKPAILMLAALSALGVLTSHAADTEPNVKRSTSGICYARGERGYSDTRSYRSFDSLEDCVNAGGRRPNLKGFFSRDEQPAPSTPAATPAPAPTAAPVQASAPAKAAEGKALFDTDDPTIVKKSRDGLCHDSSSAVFADTVHFIAYRTLQDCLQSGGRK